MGCPVRPRYVCGCCGWGHHELTRAKPQAEDWVWMIDHTNQVGVENCLVILGIRRCDLPPPGQYLPDASISQVPDPGQTPRYPISIGESFEARARGIP